MKFETLFKFASFAAVFCGFLSLWVSGAFGVVGTGSFLAVLVAAWFLEGTRWRIPERVGTALIMLSVPVYYLSWRYRIFEFSSTEAMVTGILARLILTLTAIKLLQKKSDRDWIFLYLMSFFQVLLAAGMSISALFFGSFVAYVFVMVCVTVIFEIRKTGRRVTADRAEGYELSAVLPLPCRRIPVTALVLIIGIIAFATPMFFLLPRVGGAGFGGGQGPLKVATGFSDTVQLGRIGTIQQSDEVVMRVRLENRSSETPFMRWRGLALDTFDNRSWSRSRNEPKEPHSKGERDFIQLDYASGRESLTAQSVYLEPLDTPVLFGLTRIVGVQGSFSMLWRDANGSVSFPRTAGRISYKVLSDTSLPPVNRLRADNTPYPRESSNYLLLPSNLDSRISALAKSVMRDGRNRYDAAKAIESYLQNDFGYTLEQKAGGPDPLADFLFNVRQGHCEYFATAMAVMLRTQGIATRVVNGFQRGEYNETADVYVVRQRTAHSWVEVYFPGEDVWVPFDPTPSAGQNLTDTPAGLAASFNKYMEALQMFWIQYFVAYDNQEQRSLFTSIRRGISDYNTRASAWTDDLKRRLNEWWQEVRGDKGFDVSVSAIGYGSGYILALIFGILLFVWLARKVVKLKVWQRLWDRFFGRRHASIVEFYDRMQTVLASKGYVREPHQTPLEFAFALSMPEAVKITERYNRVRFGEKGLTGTEVDEMENWLEEISNAETQKRGET
jgi:protein-glutamine gamma-glutamyltransferase